MIFKNNLRGINYISRAPYCAKPQSSKKYSRTILLPKTQFPLKLNNNKLIERDDFVYNSAGFEKLYDWQRAHLSEPEFILHDGPPYANGQSHMGHAINKILKDTILRSKILNGYKVHYIPGWDCHGLPIELKALSGTKEEDPIEIREKARNFAKKAIEKQKEMFKSWGVLGDWKNAYTTYSADYMKLQFRQFFKLYEKKFIYRDVKPVYWSPSSMTALAEAELEYNEKHESTSAYVKVKIIDDKLKLGAGENKNIYGIIWTTTPWTLPSNQGVCYNKTLSYSIVKASNLQDDLFIVSSDLVEEISKVLNTTLEVVKVVSGNNLDGIVYEHPVYKDKMHSFVSAPHVCSTKGTGLVHLAGAHGREDFLVCLENKMNITDLIDDRGCYVADAGSSLKGKYSLTEGNNTVLELLGDSLLHKEIITHSYPYDWRTKKPVIIKASKQWFINTDAIKNRAVELLENVKILPSDRSDIYKNNLIKQIKKRPYWCISRQRKWGVPIPILYNKTTSENIINQDSIQHYCRLVDEVGTDFWWRMSAKQLLPEIYSPNDDIVKCEDIMDIWLDSGLSWSKVLDGAKVADMYLEGVDQFTGWFQSSLLTSVALRDKAPYKSIYVHGFAVDENGMKMSKSLGNVVDPLEVTNGNENKTAYGVDVLRWWVTCHANQHALANVSTNTLDSCTEEVQKIRSVLRFALSSLSDYEKENIEKTKLLFIDRYMLHLLYNFHNKSSEFIEDFQYHKLSNAIINFITNSVSAFYYNSIKDRLYCNIVDSTERRSAQFTLYQIFEILTQSIAPMLPHLVEELYLHFPQKQNKTFFTSEHSKPTDEWKDLKIEKLFEILLLCKRDINKEVGANTADKIVEIMFSKNVCFNDIKPISNLKELERQLIDIFQVSNVIVTQGDISKIYKIKISQSKKCVCPRCRKINADHEDELCRRCYEAVNYLRSKSSFVIN